jgi:Bacterial Ig domain
VSIWRLEIFFQAHNSKPKRWVPPILPRYTPNKDWNGTDSFTYQASDGQANSAVVSVMITVKPVNDAPAANNASYTLAKNGSLIINLNSLVSDVDGDVLTLTVKTPLHGSLTKNSNGTYTYKPVTGYIGSDSFSYTVSDGLLNTTATVSLVVTATTTITAAAATTTMMAEATVPVTRFSATASPSLAPVASTASIVINTAAKPGVNTGGTVTDVASKAIRYLVTYPMTSAVNATVPNSNPVQNGASRVSNTVTASAPALGLPKPNADIRIDWQNGTTPNLTHPAVIAMLPQPAGVPEQAWLPSFLGLRSNHEQDKLDNPETLAKKTGLRIHL